MRCGPGGDLLRWLLGDRAGGRCATRATGRAGAVRSSVRAALPGLHSHPVSRPKDQISGARASSTTARFAGAGRRPAAATSRTMPWSAATVLRAMLGGSGAVQPRQDAGGGDEDVAHGADQQHPGAQRRGDVDAEHQDEEGVDLHVEARAQREERAGAPGDLAVDRVEDQRHRGEGDEDRDPGRAREGVRDQRGHAADERGPGQGDAVGGPEGRQPGPAQRRG